MAKAFKKLGREFGADYVGQFEENAKSIINGEQVFLNDLNRVKHRTFLGKI